MLSNRQLQILEYFSFNLNTYMPAKDIGNFLNVSVRTTLNDLAAIRNYSELHPFFKLETISSKGTKLVIIDEQQFDELISVLKKKQRHNVNTKNSRIEGIIKFLFDRENHYVSKHDLLNRFYVSETTLYNSVSEVKKILEEFDLKLEYRTNHGYRITGNELNKRTCIAKMGLDYTLRQTFLEDTNKIYNVVANTFIKYQYRVTQETLQNITAHVSNSLQRTQHHHYIEQSFESELSSTTEYLIADEILSTFISKKLMKQQHYKNELNFLTLIILGKIDYTGNDHIQEKVNHFIDQAFESIYQKFSINFDSIDNLRLLLALHLVPLFYRIQSGTQLTNPLDASIHQSFPQAHDIALYFSMLVRNEFQLVVSKDEVSYLTLYFNYGLENYLSTSIGKKLLIITPLRKSETILMKHKILHRLPKQIEVIDFVSPKMINNSIKAADYDAIFTTERHMGKHLDVIPTISLFPTEQDLRKIEMTLNGYSSLQSVLEKFNEKCFFSGQLSSKEDLLTIVLNNAVANYQLDDSFVSSVKNREEMTSTYFGNGVAAPHALTPISDTTFVSVAILNNDVAWDNQNMVRIVLLVSIAKNNPKELQFWDYLASFMQNEGLIKKVLDDPTFSNFIHAVKIANQKKFD